MGELVKTNNGTSASGETLEGFLSSVHRAKQSITVAINSDDSLRAAFAEADAKMVLLSSMDERISAYLLRFCDPKLQMVECVNNPSDEDKVRVVALAILNGFVPGDDDFAVFAGKGGAKLYTKESGYRKLFARLNGCRNVDVNPGHPMFVSLGTTDKKVWRVEGVASCEVAGEIHKVECLRKFAIGIPGYETDNVAGIAAKARRRLLQLLWKKVVAMRFDDHDDTEQASVTVAEPAAITEAPAVEISDYERDVKMWAQEWKSFAHRFGPDSTTLAIARRMRDSTSHEELMAVVSEIEPLRPATIGQRDYDNLSRYLDHLAKRPQEVTA